MLIPRIFHNILFSLVLNFFYIYIFLKFWHSILELFSTDPTMVMGF
jgi:hypothetical protein